MGESLLECVYEFNHFDVKIIIYLTKRLVTEMNTNKLRVDTI